MEFSGAPNLNNVETGGQGLPATPFVPNPTSPGEGVVSAANVAPAPKEFVNNQTPSAWPQESEGIVNYADLASTAKAVAVDGIEAILTPVK